MELGIGGQSGVVGQAQWEGTSASYRQAARARIHELEAQVAVGGCLPSRTAGGPGTRALPTRMDFETRVAFASILLLRVDSLSQALQTVDWDLLAFALMGANEVVRDQVFRSLNPRLVPLIQGFMDQLEDISQEEISQAQQTVIGLMRFQAERARTSA